MSSWCYSWILLKRPDIAKEGKSIAKAGIDIFNPNFCQPGTIYGSSTT